MLVQAMKAAKAKPDDIIVYKKFDGGYITLPRYPPTPAFVLRLCTGVACAAMSSRRSLVLNVDCSYPQALLCTGVGYPVLVACPTRSVVLSWVCS